MTQPEEMDLWKYMLTVCLCVADCFCECVSVSEWVCGKSVSCFYSRLFIYFKDGHKCKYSGLYATLANIQSNCLQSTSCTSTVHAFHVMDFIFYCKCFNRSYICCHITSDEGLQNTYVIVKRITLNKMLLKNKPQRLSEFELYSINSSINTEIFMLMM